jgi:NAD-dependent SIR2 family protein deacetylase
MKHYITGKEYRQLPEHLQRKYDVTIRPVEITKEDAVYRLNTRFVKLVDEFSPEFKERIRYSALHSRIFELARKEDAGSIIEMLTDRLEEVQKQLTEVVFQNLNK